MSDRCGHGVLLDAMSCSDCIAEENDTLMDENERLRQIVEAARAFCGCEVGDASITFDRLLKALGEKNERTH